MKLFNAIKVADIIKFGHEVVADVEFYGAATMAHAEGYVELSYPDRMGYSHLQFRDQEIAIDEDGYASVLDMDDENQRLRFCTLVPMSS